MYQTIQELRSYRATLIPENIQSDEVEFQAAQGLLPTIRVKAPDADRARADAHKVSGRPVFNVERVEVV